ncbi:MAG: ice-binding family protein [Candidatus Hydrogenedentales bacterium]|jgi:hypothetical protein
MNMRSVLGSSAIIMGCVALAAVLGGCPPGAGNHNSDPSVSSTNPIDAASDVAINTRVTVTFSEAMNPATVTEATFTLDDGVTPISGTVAYAGVSATFAPSATLAANTEFTATITTGAEDLAGHELEADYIWTFTTSAITDVIPPFVSSTDPVDLAIGVPINKSISATFSEAMDPVSITAATFTLDEGVTPVLGTVTYTGLTAVFNPTQNLTPGTAYTATISTGVEDLSGNASVSDEVWTFTTGITTAQGEVNLRSTNTFAILAGSTVVNANASTVTGDLGVSPGTGVVGFPPGILIGTQFTGVTSAAGQAKLDLTRAFNDAADRTVGSISLPGDLGGLTLFPGLYTNSSSVLLSAGFLTLDAQGDSDAVFIFQMGSTLTTGAGTQVILSGGAKAANIYWQVGTSATLGTNSIFKGNILAASAITLTSGTNLEGRALTRIAAVTLDACIVTVPAP